MSAEDYNLDFISLGLTTAADDALKNVGFMYESIFITRYHDDEDEEMDEDDDGEPESPVSTLLPH